jgi:hypothetical protein
VNHALTALGCGLAVLAIAGPASGQRPAAAFARVRGYVYDSLLTKATVPQARVILAGPSNRQVTADARGRFAADSLEPGKYQLTFTHPSFDDIGYTPPSQTVELRAGVTTPVFLSTTAGHGIYAALCPSVREEQTGVVLGQLTDVRTERPLIGAEVRVEWSESVFSRELGVSRRNRAAHSATDSAGRYRICGVPNDVPVLLRARARGLDGPPLELQLEERPIAIRMLTLDLGDSATRVAESRTVDSGTAVLRGSIRGNDGKAVPEAQVLVLGLETGARSTESGGFELTRLPAGTHTVEVRAIGYGRRRELVNLHPERPATLNVTLNRMAVVLPEVAVTAKGPALSEFDERRRSAAGGGHFITREDIERRNPLRTEDLFRGVPGFSVVPSGGFDYSIVSTRGVTGMGQCMPDFYLDGAKITVDPQMGGGLPVNPNEIAGIETYSGASTIPAGYISQSGCGVVLIWTQRGQSRRR